MSSGVCNNGLDSFRKRLPIFGRKDDIIQAVSHNPTVIIVGETACGKTTQLPQYLLELRSDEDGGGMIGCTQPRRIAAISVAKRVAREMNCALGAEVGYAVRFENNVSAATRLKYMSDGILIRESITDPLLSQYSAIILDEVHERSVNTDLLCSLLRYAQRKRRSIQRPVLQVILMSATIEPSPFQRFFASRRKSKGKARGWHIPPVIYLKGRMFPVDVFHVEHEEKTEKDYDYENASVTTLVKINREFPSDHGVLVFLTGQEEIDSYVKYVRKLGPQFVDDCGIGMEVSPLYANMSVAAQMNALSSPKAGTRKVIVATNVAESSLTIPGIRIVVDCGRVKRKNFNPASGIESLNLEMISQAEAWQRTGRAGRQNKGYCFRLYTESNFESLPAEIEPQISRVSLSNVFLQLIAIGFQQPLKFAFVSRVTMKAIVRAVRELKQLGCIRELKNSKSGQVKNRFTTTARKLRKFKLTRLGKQIILFPLDVRLAKCLVTADSLGCLRSVLHLVSLLSVDSILQFSAANRDQYRSELKKFSDPTGDHLTYLRIFQSFKRVDKSQSDWCRRHCVSFRNLRQAEQICLQLSEICDRCGMIVDDSDPEHEDNIDVMKALCSGFTLQIASYYRDNFYRTLSGQVLVEIHPSSVLFQATERPEMVVFRDLLRSNRSYIRVVSSVTPRFLEKFESGAICEKLEARTA